MVPEWLSTLLGVILCVMLVPYVLGPILVFFTLRFRMPPKVIAIDPQQHPLPIEARDFLGKAYLELKDLGFELRGTIALPDLVPNVKTLFAIYTNRAMSDLAMSAIIVAEGGVTGELKTCYVEFVRRYDDDVVVQTNNSSELSSFKRRPREFTTKVWQVQDIRRLYHLHQFAAERFRERGQPVDRLNAEYGGDVIRYIAQAVLSDTFREQIGTGYLAENVAGFRPTVYGASVMAWKELWPIKSIRRWREKQRGQRLLMELDSRSPGV